MEAFSVVYINLTSKKKESVQKIFNSCIHLVSFHRILLQVCSLKMREQQEISSLQNEESSSVDPSLTGSSVGQSEEGSARHERDTRLYTLRVAFVGNVDSGKSSLIGTLIKGELDDGRGSSRKAIFRHKHEIETGRTSSVATAYIGFDVNGNQIVSKRAGKSIPSAELASIAEKRIQLIDLAGHEKYLKTTVYGLTGMQPDIVIVVIGANMGVKRMTKEHLAIAVAVSGIIARYHLEKTTSLILFAA